LDQIYSPITSHHTIAQIDKALSVCDFYLFIIPLAFIGCWIAFILYNAVFGMVIKNLSKLWTDSLPLGFGAAIIGFVCLSNSFSC